MKGRNFRGVGVGRGVGMLAGLGQAKAGWNREAGEGGIGFVKGKLKGV